MAKPPDLPGSMPTLMMVLFAFSLIFHFLQGFEDG
jgi:hypothetical protein